MSFLLFIPVSFPINMGISKDFQERKQESKRISPWGATQGPTSQITKGTKNLVTTCHMKTNGLGQMKMTFSINTAQTLYTPKSSIWVRWSMRKSNITISGCQTGKTLTEQKKYSPVSKLFLIQPPPEPVLTTLPIIGFLYSLSYISPTFCWSKPFSSVPGSSSELCSGAQLRQDLLPTRADSAESGWA